MNTPKTWTSRPRPVAKFASRGQSVSEAIRTGDHAPQRTKWHWEMRAGQLGLASVFGAVVTGCVLPDYSGGSNQTTGSGGSTTGGRGSSGDTQGYTGGALSIGGRNNSGGTVAGNGGASNVGGVGALGGTVSSGGSSSATGGATNSGGTLATGGQVSIGGTNATGGRSATGGFAPTGGIKGSGGNSVTGGTNATGGMAVAGGAVASGGTHSTGGTVATGGFVPTGGMAATGGANTTGGGTIATGGIAATGGMLQTGGTLATGGSAASGGTVATGGTNFSSAGGIPVTGGTSASSGGACPAGGTAGTAGLVNCGISTPACARGLFSGAPAEVTTDVTAQYFLWNLVPDTLVGSRYVLNTGDDITALGAFMSLTGTVAGTIQLAIYSDNAGNPGSLISATDNIQTGGFDTGCSNTVAVVGPLTNPAQYTVPTTNYYWFLLRVTGTALANLVTENSGTLQPTGCVSSVASWATQGPASFAISPSCDSGSSALGVVPFLFAINMPAGS